ncbi:MAG: LacI family DNA-binding transcriptional regulator [Rectinemataceae bacterium]|nr:LacI family DNA-binding transcriptional regulator [Rectinemataceae bacterium]
MKKTTLKDVAEAAGVSIAAVSMILSGKGKISPAVANRVRALSEEMGYSRKSPDSALCNRRFKYVSILQREDFPYLWNFSQPFATFLEEEVIRMGYYPLILHIPAAATAKSVFREITGARVGAVFAIHYADPELFRDLEDVGIPVIIINNSEYQTRFFSVLADEVQGASEATKHLVELGHRIIGYADYIRPNYPTLINDRFFGYWKALEESGLEYMEANRISVSLPDFEALTARVVDIYRQSSPPTAFSVHDDYFAAYLMEALRRIGKQVPKDVSIIATGGDVLDYRVPFIPKIDTMQINQKLMVSMAWNLLESRLQSPTGIVQVLKTKMPFVDRGSCRFDMD